MASGSVILQDVLEDLLVLGEAAVGIFVKNPNSQATAARIINVVANTAPLIQQQIQAQQTPANTASANQVAPAAVLSTTAAVTGTVAQQ